jgi:HEAT repeat protein
MSVEGSPSPRASESSAGTNGPASGRELPPVEPPSAKFVVQLFLIPLAIVLVLVLGLSLVYFVFGSLATGGHSASDYIQAIRSGNENRRWRAATDLASLLHNDQKLASDPKLVADLSDLLSSEMRSKLEDARVAQFLALTLGVVDFPAGSAGGEGSDLIKPLLLACGGPAPADVRIAAITSLSQQVAKNRAIRQRDDVYDVVAAAVADEEAQVRQRAVYALAAYDDRAAAQDLLRSKVNEDSDRLVRYNAAAALAKSGDQAARDVLREMLSPRDLAQVITEETPEQNARKVEAIQLEALVSLKEGVQRGRKELAESLRGELGALSKEGTAQVRVQASSLLKSLP